MKTPSYEMRNLPLCRDYELDDSLILSDHRSLWMRWEKDRVSSESVANFAFVETSLNVVTRLNTFSSRDDEQYLLRIPSRGGTSKITGAEPSNATL